MITLLSLKDKDTVQQIWALQHMAYPLEAERIGFSEIPPLMDTFESIALCGEIFYGFETEDGELAGAIAVEEKPDTVTISRMMVHPDCFRQGIASSLVQHVLDTYREVQEFTVSTGLKNTPAVRLYEKFGFQPEVTYEVAPGVELSDFRLVLDR